MAKLPGIIEIFDRDLVRANRDRAAEKFSDHDFLFRWTVDQLRDRLKDVKRDFSSALQIGGRGGAVRDPCIILEQSTRFAPGVIADEEILPFARESFDLVTSALSLHTVNDLPGTLIQINRALKPDGLFLAALLGGETLWQLRRAMMEAEIAVRGGASPHVAPFADKQQMGALMQRAGFALPVVDCEIVTVTYDSTLKLMHDLRGMGEGNCIADRSRKFSRRALFAETERRYREQFSEPDGKLRATFEVIFLIGWAPHHSQQKPLRPGSAEKRLADVLNTTEIKTDGY